jgi:hypothetical protein
MSNSLLPSSSFTQADDPAWTEIETFSAYGLCFGLRSNDSSALAQVMAHLPLGWQPFPTDEVDILYTLQRASSGEREGQHKDHLLYCGSALLARSMDFAALLAAFENHAQLLTAFSAQDCLFVHAGCVGWQGRAILIPGRSMAGKTTLVKALVESGATYYSDEFAVLDNAGRVHPYALRLSIRENNGQPGRKTPVESLGGKVGIEPLPVGLIVVTHYQPRARWQPRALSPAQALLALMDNTVAAQRDPQYTMPILRQAVMNAHSIQSMRGSAQRIAHILLAMFQ